MPINRIGDVIFRHSTNKIQTIKKIKILKYDRNFHKSVIIAGNESEINVKFKFKIGRDIRIIRQAEVWKVTCKKSILPSVWCKQ